MQPPCKGHISLIVQFSLSKGHGYRIHGIENSAFSGGYSMSTGTVF